MQTLYLRIFCVFLFFMSMLLLLSAQGLKREIKRGVTVRFNNESMCITIHSWRYDTKTIRAHLERYNIIRCSY